MLDGYSLSDTGVPLIKGYNQDGSLTMLAKTENPNLLFENCVYGTEATTNELPGSPASNPGVLSVYSFNDGTDMYLLQTWYDTTTNEFYTRRAKKEISALSATLGILGKDD